MHTSSHAYRLLSALLVAVFLNVTVFLPAAQAAMVSTGELVSQAEIAEKREQVKQFISRDDVRQKLEAEGVSADMATARVEAMTDAEVIAMSDKIDSMPAGGDGLIGAAVFVFLVLLFTDIMGWTDIFPFTRPVQ